jgi:hypothetical protein
MPFPRVAGLFVGSERWSGLGCLLQVRVRLRTALSKCVAVCPEKLNEFFGPLLTCGILRALTSAAKSSLALKSTLLERIL